VQSLLTARVDRLASADRALLQAAAVIGRHFDPDLLAVVTGTSGDIVPSLGSPAGIGPARIEPEPSIVLTNTECKSEAPSNRE
jgi:hypothetical protein